MTKKKKPIVPKAASAEALKLAVELLDVAETDLAAALTLHRASHYPQAVFHLQQSVEKIGKAFGLGMGIVEPNQLQTEWSHNTLKHSEVFADYSEQEGRVGAGMTPDRIKAFINELKDPGKVKGPAMGILVAWVLSLVKQHNKYKSDPVRRQKELADMTTSVVGKRTDPAAVAKATALAEVLVDWVSENALIMPTTMVLGMVTAPHAVIARYPSKTTSQRSSIAPTIRRSRHCPSSAWFALRS